MVQTLKKYWAWILAGLSILGALIYAFFRFRFRKDLVKAYVGARRKLRELEQRRKSIENLAARSEGAAEEVSRQLQQLDKEIQDVRRQISAIKDTRRLADEFERLGY